MVCTHVRSIIHSLKLGNYLSVQAHKPCSVSHVFLHQHNVLCDPVVSISYEAQKADHYQAHNRKHHSLRSSEAFNITLQCPVCYYITHDWMQTC